MKIFMSFPDPILFNIISSLSRSPKNSKKITFEMLPISKSAFRRKAWFSLESTPSCGGYCFRVSGAILKRNRFSRILQIEIIRFQSESFCKNAIFSRIHTTLRRIALAGSESIFMLKMLCYREGGSRHNMAWILLKNVFFPE